MIGIDLSGKTALVTGGSGQLGRTMVRTLLRAGADVAIHYYRNRAQAEKLVAEALAMGRKAIAVQADVTDENSILAMRDEVSSLLSAPDIIVNNAVVQYDWKDVLTQPLADYESQWRSCVMHNVLMAKAFVPAMIAKKQGRVIGINTECAMQCFETQSAYVSGKRGMDGVLRVLAKEIGRHGITVNEVAPGWTKSEESSDEGGEYAKSVPLKRRGTDQEIANAVLFLASDLASYITGAYIPVCGGNEMPCI